MKKIFAILLITALTVPFWGAYVFLQSRIIRTRGEVKQQILAGMDHESTVLLKFSLADTRSLLDWEHPGEFEYKGQMYDVVESVTIGDTVLYRCYADHKESRIRKEIRKVLAEASGQNPVRKNQTEKLSDFFKILVAHASFKLLDYPVLSPISLISHPDVHFSSFSLSPPSPPPKSNLLFC